jgi:pseudouridylate synthase / pseudouridine kinase
VAVDLSCDYAPLGEDAKPSSEQQSHEVISPQMHTSNVASITPSIGGVGHNVALAAHRAGGGTSVQLRSVIASDL